jgi:hypothetical protein
MRFRWRVVQQIASDAGGVIEDERRDDVAREHDLTLATVRL